MMMIFSLINITITSGFNICDNIFLISELLFLYLTDALRKMDGMFSMKDAWLVHSMQGDGNDDPSDAKLPQFAELFFMLLATIQGTRMICIHCIGGILYRIF